MNSPQQAVFPAKAKIIIAGGRTFTDFPSVCKEAAKHDIGELVCGMAKGADKCGWSYAKNNNILIAEFPADWEKHGKRAGPIRNCQMGDYADGLIAFWDGKSSGTAHMISYMRKLNKPVIIVGY